MVRVSWFLVLSLSMTFAATSLAADKKADSEKKPAPAVKKDASAKKDAAAKPQAKAPSATAKKPEDKKPDAGGVSFKNDIAPLLVQNCLACHGVNDPKG